MTEVIAAPSPVVDLAALKDRQRAAWSAGNYAVVGTTLQIVGENLCEALDLHAGARVLDVAAGNGNATLAAARQGKAASELARVCKPGGKIGLANWTPESFIGQVFKTIGKYIAPPAGVPSPALWGTNARLEELFGKSSRRIRTTSREFIFRYRSPVHWIEVFRTYYGPMNRTFGALDAEQRDAFTRDLFSLIETRNRAGDGTVVVPGAYLEAVIERK